jgi:hypothetical protein
MSSGLSGDHASTLLVIDAIVKQASDMRAELSVTALERVDRDRLLTQIADVEGRALRLFALALIAG